MYGQNIGKEYEKIPNFFTFSGYAFIFDMLLYLYTIIRQRMCPIKWNIFTLDVNACLMVEFDAKYKFW